jgi:murein DD-endopeptidase MepM/ murein hydrolase activator NlpD
MIPRRAFLATGAAALVLPRVAWARESRLVFPVSLEQGKLVVGHAPPGTRVTVDGKRVRVSDDGAFVFGFAYNRTRPVRVKARYADGTSEMRALTPKTRTYKTQRISGLPQRLVTPPPKDIARIHREHARIFRARKRDTAGVGFAEPFEWPFPGIVSGVYGSRRIDNGTPMAPHLGFDIAAPAGTPIHAPADAVVSICDMYFLEGGFTLLDHGHGVSTCYLHQSKRMVKVGDKIARGQVIGLVGQTGRATGPHTHWGMNWFQIKLDPSLSTPTPLPPRS